MTTVGRIKKDGSFLLNNEINERLPVVVDGLIAYYPLDSQAGAVDAIKGNGTTQNLESGVNILEALSTSWRTASIWQNSNITWDSDEQALKAVNGCNGYASNFIAVDTSKSYYLEADVKMSAGNTGILYYGYRFYDQNFNEIGIGQHHGTYDYTGCSSLAPTTTWVHLKNNGIGGAPKTGEGDTGGSVFHTGTKYVKLLFLFNYAGAGTTWVKSLKLSTSNTNTSNVIITGDGISVQEATTNLVDTISPDFNNWGGFTGTSNYFLAPNGSKGVVLNGLTSGGVMWRQASMPSQVVSPSTTYTVSAKIKFIYDTVSANFFYIRQYNSSWVQVSEYGVYSSSNKVKLDNGYYQTWGTFTTTSDCTYIVIQGYEYAAPNTIWCYDLQLEQRGFATAFVDGSGGSGSLTIPLPVGNTNFTIFGLIKNMREIGNNIPNNDYNLALTCPNGSGARLRYYISGVTIVPWIDADDWPGKPYTHQHANAGITFAANTWLAFKIVRNGSGSNALKFALLKEDGVWYNWYESPTTNEYFNGFVMAGSYGTIFKSVGVYNKILSDSEINQLLGEGFKITSTKATTPLVIESPVIPLDGYYFPLVSDSSNDSKVITASESTNLVYDSGSWVGSANNNISTYSSDFTSGWNYNYASIVSTGNISPFASKTAYLVNFTANVWDIYRNYSVTSGLEYTFSIYVKLGTTTNFCIVVNNTADWNIGVSKEFTSTDGLSTKIYKRISITFTAPATGSVNIHLGGHGSNSINQQIAGTAYISNHQLEQRNYLTPYIPSSSTQGSRGASSLEYNLNSSIGLNWSGDWSICYWKKPVGTYINDLTGYNIESLGCNGNSVGGAYNWWGKDNSSNNISGTDIGAFNPNDYFKLWQFITIIKTGGSCIVKTKLNNNVVYTRSLGVTGVANGYVTQYGYDLKLGGWDNGNPTNTYFRDLIVVKRALSDAEVQNIYKQFSIYKTKVNTQNLIEEGI